MTTRSRINSRKINFTLITKAYLHGKRQEIRINSNETNKSRKLIYRLSSINIISFSIKIKKTKNSPLHNVSTKYRKPMFSFENGRRLCVIHFNRVHTYKLIGDLDFFCGEIFTKANLSYFIIYLLG